MKGIYLLIFIALIIVIAVTIRFMKILQRHTKKHDDIDDKALFELIKDAGYSYDQDQDIFYANLDAWQRNNGYCRLYDEALVPMGMIIDCEPIYFEYDNKDDLLNSGKDNMIYVLEQKLVYI